MPPSALIVPPDITTDVPFGFKLLPIPAP